MESELLRLTTCAQPFEGKCSNSETHEGHSGQLVWDPRVSTVQPSGQPHGFCFASSFYNMVAATCFVSLDFGPGYSTAPVQCFVALKEQKEQKAEKTALSWTALKLLSWEWWWLPAPCPSSASWALLKQKSVQGESLYQVPAHGTKQSLVFLWLWLLGP